MDNTELKNALLTKKPVIFAQSDGRESVYKCVSAIRYTAKNGRIVVSAEITDRNGNSVIYCDPEKLRFKEV